MLCSWNILNYIRRTYTYTTTKSSFRSSTFNPLQQPHSFKQMAVRSKRVTDPLTERVKNRIVGRYTPENAYDSSGSEHSATVSQIADHPDSNSNSSSHSLSYLLNRFNEEGEYEAEDESDHESDSYSDSESDRVEAKTEEISSKLRDLNDDTFRNALHANVVKAMNVFRCLKPNAQILNRNVMLFLQKLGYNAAVCKTKWQSSGGLTAGNYEFIDVVRSESSDNGVRYFIDVNFAGEFDIARQTNQFRRLTEILPTVFVGKSADLKQIVRLMSDEIRRSLKSRGMLLPPWRKNRFMQNKWFGPYRRTVNYTPANISSSISVPVSQTLSAVKCSMIGFSVVDGAPLLNATT